MGQILSLPLRKKACWGFIRTPEKSKGFGRVRTRELGVSGVIVLTTRPPKPLSWGCYMYKDMAIKTSTSNERPKSRWPATPDVQETCMWQSAEDRLGLQLKIRLVPRSKHTSSRWHYDYLFWDTLKTQSYKTRHLPRRFVLADGTVSPPSSFLVLSVCPLRSVRPLTNTHTPH